MKKFGKTLEEKQTDEMKMSDFLEKKKFKVMIIKMLRSGEQCIDRVRISTKR